MGALKLTACMKVVAKMGDMDQEALLERLDRYTADGVPKDRAQLMAAADTLAELQDERREFMRLLREQHPQLFVVSSAIPEDQDVDPDAPDIKRSAGRSEDEIASARADGWTIADNDLPSREAAERIVKLRTKGNSIVKPMAAWQDAEVRVVESDNPGFWAIETRKAGVKRSPARDEITIDLSADREKRKKAKEWVTKVSEMFPRNPMDGRQRVMMFGEEDMAIFELDDSVTSPGAVEVKWIQAYPLRRGNGTKAMKELQRLVAEDGMSLTLYPWDKGRVSQASLIKFYKKQGFETIRKGGKDMIWRPDGEIKRSPARMYTDTPEFKRWFGDSKVVDADGKPLVVYHGTRFDFAEFDGYEVAGWFSATPDLANERYAFGESDDAGANMMPVYLAIKNPKILDGDMDDAGDNGSPRFEQINNAEYVQKLIQQGYDGIVVNEDGRRTYAAFRPEQIKSAISNRGTFDPDDADITRSPGRTATGAAWDSPSASKWDDAVYKMQDKQVDLKRVTDAIQDAGGAIADDLNVYLQEELYHGRAAKRTEDFVNLELNPLVERLAKDGLELSDLEEFLHARHAPEANAVIAQRNPGVPGLQDGGSGMKTADAMNYMAGLPADMRQKLEAAAAKVDDILVKTREMYVDYELESRDTVDAWGKMFQHYIPLMREDKDGNGSPGIGQGFSIKGKEVKGRTGSTRKVVDILANIALQREKAIVRGEKNRVSQALVGLATANPNEGFWQVDEVPTERVFNEKTGLVEDRVDPLYKSRPNAVIAKIKDGSGKVKEHAVLFNEEDERAMRMAAALKNLDAAQLEGLMGVSAMISRYFASINTSLNPIFGVVNAIRDIQGVALNLQSTAIAGEQKKVLSNTASAIAAIYGDARKARKGVAGNSKWAALWDEFQQVGGQTGYRDLFRTSGDRANEIKKTLDPDAWTQTKLGKVFTAGGVLKVPMAQAKRAAGWIFDLIEDYNLAMENGVRLSVYKAGLDKGLSKEQAASIAKNASTNFNRKGQIGQQAGALYAFFNASVQGTARIGQTIFDMEPGKPKTIRLSSFGKKVVYGGMMLGVIQALALAAAGYNDEDPPDFVRERSLIIPVAGGKYITIPMPLGFNVIPNIGRMAAEFAMSGFKNPEERAVKLISLFADTMNPIGNAGLSMQTLAPTALDPLVALTENKDYTGKPIARESSNEAIPGHALGRDTATSVAKLISEAVNALSGGNKYTSGVFSPTPDQIDYLIGQLTGGVGRELSKVEQSTLAVARGEDLPTYKIPLAGRFFGDTRSQASEGTAFYANTERLNRLETEIKGLQKDGKTAEAAELRRSSSEAYLITMANQAERQIQKLRSEKRELVKSGAPREQVAAVEERITVVMARLNRAVESLRDKQEN